LTVEIDETLVYKRKSHVGRLLHCERNQVWILGGICRETSKAFVIKVPDRRQETLLAAIMANVEPETRIITDMWRGYYNLMQYGFQHAAVNHQYNFVHPQDPSVNTQRVERMWRTMKSIIPNASNNETRFSYLAEFIFKQQHGWYALSIGARIKLIIDQIRTINFN
jgi:hypothetical protein